MNAQRVQNGTLSYGGDPFEVDFEANETMIAYRYQQESGFLNFTVSVPTGFSQNVTLDLFLKVGELCNQTHYDGHGVSNLAYILETPSDVFVCIQRSTVDAARALRYDPFKIRTLEVDVGGYLSDQHFGDERAILFITKDVKPDSLAVVFQLNENEDGIVPQGHLMASYNSFTEWTYTKPSSAYSASDSTENTGTTVSTMSYTFGHISGEGTLYVLATSDGDYTYSFYLTYSGFQSIFGIVVLIIGVLFIIFLLVCIIKFIREVPKQNKEGPNYLLLIGRPGVFRLMFPIAVSSGLYILVSSLVLALGSTIQGDPWSLMILLVPVCIVVGTMYFSGYRMVEFDGDRELITTSKYRFLFQVKKSTYPFDDVEMVECKDWSEYFPDGDKGVEYRIVFKQATTLLLQPFILQYTEDQKMDLVEKLSVMIGTAAIPADPVAPPTVQLTVLA